MFEQWSVQVDDTVGGWVVTTYPFPMSQHDFRPDGDPAKRGRVAAECQDEDTAWVIANYFNKIQY